MQQAHVFWYPSTVTYAPHCRMSVSDDCISSNVRPLVSGTSFAMKRTPKPQMLEYMKNVPEMVFMHN